MPALRKSCRLPPEYYELIEADEDNIPGAEVFTEISNLEHLSETLKQKGYEVVESELRWIPGNNYKINDPDIARSLLKLMDALEDLDDVQNVTHPTNYAFVLDLRQNSKEM